MSISFKFYRSPDEKTLKGRPIVTKIRVGNTFRSETAWDIIMLVYECRVFGRGWFLWSVLLLSARKVKSNLILLLPLIKTAMVTGMVRIMVFFVKKLGKQQLQKAVHRQREIVPSDFNR